MIPEPPLLIIAPLADDLDLAHLPWCEEAAVKIAVNRAKFRNLEMVEVIVHAMPFLLSRLTALETGQQITAGRCEPLACDLPSAGESAIGIALGDNLTSAKHLPEVNGRLLLLGKWIGESLAATTVGWLPSRRLISFASYAEGVDQYLADGRFPSFFQTCFSEVRSGHFVTSGLHYFADQEIRLTAPVDYSLVMVTECLVRIIEDIAAHGKIDRPARSAGMFRGETLIYTPSDYLGHVDISIRNDAFDADPAKI